jgi:hypothetical protein
MQVKDETTGDLEDLEAVDKLARGPAFPAEDVDQVVDELLATALAAV